MTYSDLYFDGYVKQYNKLKNDSNGGDDICTQLKALKGMFEACKTHKDAQKYIQDIDNDLRRLKCP